jgi:hypothetical protein
MKKVIAQILCFLWVVFTTTFHVSAQSLYQTMPEFDVVNVPPPPYAPLTKLAISPTPAPTPTKPAASVLPKTTTWKAEYFNNAKVSGVPVVTTQAAKIYFMWGSAAPARRVIRDGFSARYTKNETFESGVYRFTVRSDDGVRLFVDNQLVINQWNAQPFGTYHSADVRMKAGDHTLRLEYYDQGGAAALDFFWVKFKK